jgi:hypothetical protein
MTVIVGRVSGNRDLDRIYQYRNMRHKTDDLQRRIWCQTDSTFNTGIVLFTGSDDATIVDEYKREAERLNEWFKQTADMPMAEIYKMVGLSE